MKLIHLTAERIAYCEDMRPYRRFVEVKGGDYHPLVPGAVMQDDFWQCPPMMIVWQNRRWPEGAELSDGEFPIQESDHAKEHFHPVSVSKRWVRGLLLYLILFIKLAALGFITAFAALMILAFAGGL